VIHWAGEYYRGGQDGEREGELFHVVFFFLPMYRRTQANQNAV